jgi:hypothetical protein
MTVNLSPLAGAGQQFFDDSGVPLAGGKLYSYQAGTTTPQVTYTTVAGNVPHSNPIILNAAGRVATGEIWLTSGQNYKFVLKTSTEVTIATWDNIVGINGTGIATNALYVQYDPAGAGAVATNVQAKLRESVSVKDFGAVGDGVTDDTVAIQAAFSSGAKFITAEAGAVYAVSGQINIATVLNFDGQNCTFSATLSAGVRLLQVTAAASIQNLTLDFNNGYALRAINFPTPNVGYLALNNVVVQNIYDLDATTLMVVIFFNPDLNEIRFDGVTLKNIKKLSDGDPSSIQGGIEGIFISAGTAGAVGGGGYMRNLTLESIRTVNSGGADVDDINNGIYFSYSTATDRRTRIIVDGVKALDFGRRLFKTQCDDLFISNVFAESLTLPAFVCLGLQEYDTFAAFNVKVKNAVIRGAMRFAVACSVTDVVLDGIDCRVSLRGITNPYGTSAFGIGIAGDDLKIINSSISADVGLYYNRVSGTYAGNLKNLQVSNTTFTQRVANSYAWQMQEISSYADIDSMIFENIVVDATLFPTFMEIGLTTKSNKSLAASNITVIDNDATLNGGSHFYVDGFDVINIVGFVHVNKDAGSQIFRSLRFRTCDSVQLDSVTFQAVPAVASASFQDITSLIVTNLFVNPAATYSLSMTTTASSRFAALRRDKVIFNDATSTSGAVFAQEFFTGTTAQRPTLQLSNGQTFWDSTLSKPIWWNGSAWEDATGAIV